jgi:hypothetical protein
MFISTVIHLANIYYLTHTSLDTGDHTHNKHGFYCNEIKAQLRQFILQIKLNINKSQAQGIHLVY